MKTDNYLTLCLEQAALSPLHYRHGCVIVRGGKVIGQGYNDYRSGFDGGALKSGRLSSTALDGPAIAKLKRKHKRKSKDSHELVGSERTKPFVPFEGTGGGHHINTPLSMHSEMMAIHSALSHSSTLASTMASYQKPCFKISGSSKRKERLRRDALKAYVERVCETAAYTGVLQVQECGFEIRASQPGKERERERQQEERGGGRFEGQGRGRGGAHMEGCGETPHESEESSSSREEESERAAAATEAVRAACTAAEAFESVSPPPVCRPVRPFWTTRGTTATTWVI